jgi:hypothetical protein
MPGHQGGYTDARFALLPTAVSNFHIEREDVQQARIRQIVREEVERVMAIERAEHRAELERYATERRAEQERYAAERRAEQERYAAERKVEQVRYAAERKADRELVATLNESIRLPTQENARLQRRVAQLMALLVAAGIPIPPPPPEN